MSEDEKIPIEEPSKDSFDERVASFVYRLSADKRAREQLGPIEEQGFWQHMLKGSPNLPPRSSYWGNADKRRRDEMELGLEALQDKSLNLEHFDEDVASGEFVEVRKAIVDAANKVIERQGMRKGIKTIERALKLRSVHLVQHPGRFDSPRIKLWSKDIDFQGFKGIVRDEYDNWALIYECDFNWSLGIGSKYQSGTDHFVRALRFDYEITDQTNPETLFT